MGKIGFRIEHTEISASEDRECHELEKKTSALISLIERVSHTGDGITADDLISKAFAILEDEEIKESIPESGTVAVGIGLIKETQSFTRTGLLEELDSLVAQHVEHFD